MARPAPARLRAMLAQGRMVAAPGACDPFTARLIERAGFEAVYLGGNAMGLSLAKGQPLITLTETVDYAAKIVRTTDLPLIVDAGAGFGAAAHVHRTVLEIELTGAAGLHIDDQPYPKRPSYHRGDGGLAPIGRGGGEVAGGGQGEARPGLHGRRPDRRIARDRFARRGDRARPRLCRRGHRCLDGAGSRACAGCACAGGASR